MKRLWKGIKAIWWDDPYEQSATVAFGIGMPLVIIVFILLTWLFS